MAKLPSVTRILPPRWARAGAGGCWTGWIKVRANQGPGRQVFHCVHGGFDTHSGQDWNHWNLLSQLLKALDAFYWYWEMRDINLGSQTTTFTQSEFGRTLQPNTNGTDYGWGGHHFVLGDAVAGGVYGTMPQYVQGSPDDANNCGVWIPTISLEQFGAPLGQWFGADAADMAYAFPSLGPFPTANLGFRAEPARRNRGPQGLRSPSHPRRAGLTDWFIMARARGQFRPP